MIAATVLVALAGGVGAALRLILNGVIHRLTATTYPVAMTIINVTGAFVLGLVAGMADVHLLSGHWSLYLGVGLVGGFTAFSTTSFQTLRLVQEHRWWSAALNSFGMLVAAIAVAGLGMWVGRDL